MEVSGTSNHNLTVSKSIEWITWNFLKGTKAANAVPNDSFN